MTYKEYREKTQSEFNALPIFWAFSNKQLEEQLVKRGYTLEDASKVLYRFGNGGFYLRSDSETIKEFFKVDHNAQLRDLMESDHKFAQEAFEYEMANHEYPINWQGDWDVCSVFGDVEYDEEKGGREYLQELGFSEAVIGLYGIASRNVRRAFDW